MYELQIGEGNIHARTPDRRGQTPGSRVHQVLDSQKKKKKILKIGRVNKSHQ